MRRADVALAVALMAIVGMMIVPLPTRLLDLLIVSNITVSVLVLLIAVRMRDALAFTAMPTLLLVTTLFRSRRRACRRRSTSACRAWHRA